MDDSVMIGFATFPNLEVARQIGTELVERQCAACVNLLPGAESIYRWEGKIHRDAEVVAIVKTTRQALPDLEAALRELHPYACPEWVAFEAADGLPAYLDWVRQNTNRNPEVG
jgi:periplasmic divalent cation tolerance protein